MASDGMNETPSKYSKPELTSRGTVTYGDLVTMDPGRKNQQIQERIKALDKAAEELRLDAVFENVAVDTFANTRQESAAVAAELNRRSSDKSLDRLAQKAVEDLARQNLADEGTVAALEVFNKGELGGYLQGRLARAAQDASRHGLRDLRQMQQRLESSGQDEPVKGGMSAEEAAERVGRAQKVKTEAPKIEPQQDVPQEDNKDFDDFKKKWGSTVLKNSKIPAGATEETKERVFRQAYQNYLAYEASTDSEGKKESNAERILDMAEKLALAGLGLNEISEAVRAMGAPAKMVNGTVNWVKERMWGKKRENPPIDSGKSQADIAAIVAATVAEMRRQEEAARATGGTGTAGDKEAPSARRPGGETPPPTPPGPPESKDRKEGEEYKGRPWSEIYADLRFAADTRLDPTSEEGRKLLKEKTAFMSWLQSTGYLKGFKDVESGINAINTVNYGGAEAAWRAIRDQVNGMNPSELERLGLEKVDPAIRDQVERMAKNVYSNLQDSLARDMVLYDDEAHGTNLIPVPGGLAENPLYSQNKTKQTYLGFEDMVPGTLRAVGKDLFGARKDVREAHLASLTSGGSGGRDYLPANIPPAEFVSLFREGRYGLYEGSWKEKVVFESIKDDGGRMRWALRNMGAFNNGIIPSPDRRWKDAVDTWLRDMKDTADLQKLNNGELKEVAETRKDLLAMMAVSSSARAMEQSGGAISTYVAILTQDPKGDLDTQDKWAEWLLHKDSEKYARVISNPLVAHYYARLKEDAGLTVAEGKDTGENGIPVCKFGTDVQVDRERARASDLVKYLRWANAGDEGYKGGFNDYIDDILLGKDDENFVISQLGNGVDRAVRWSAAKLACDAFLVDKYTRWEYEITKVRNGEQGFQRGERTLSDERGDYQLVDDMQLRPFMGWGGDPLRAVLEPSFLPRRIKGLYAGEDRAVLDMFDLAFRPDDIFAKQAKLAEQAQGERRKFRAVEPIPASMAGHLKNLARWGNAHWTALGGSRGPGLPMWSKDTLGKDLPTIADMFDQVYGESGEMVDVRIGGDTLQIKEGSFVVGAMIARVLQMKALATTQETSRPGTFDTLNQIFGDDKQGARPFLEVMQTLWGPELNGKKGWLAARASARERIMFTDRPNPYNYGTQQALSSTWDLLASNDQDPSGQAKAKAVGVARGVVGVLTAAAETWGKKR